MSELTIKDVKLGQEVVLFVGVSPCRHNSANNPAHPCRGTVTKIGRKNIYITTNGADLLIKPAQHYSIYTVEEARKIHKIELDKRAHLPHIAKFHNTAGNSINELIAKI
jgi:hypothetical protein